MRCIFMSMSKQEVVKSFIELGNGIRGHKVSGSKNEIQNNVNRVFANARKRLETKHRVD
jgi:hypothetical protein